MKAKGKEKRVQAEADAGSDDEESPGVIRLLGIAHRVLSVGENRYEKRKKEDVQTRNSGRRKKKGW